MKNVKSCEFFSSAVAAVCMFSDLSTSYDFDETRSKLHILLHPKQWSPSALLLLFMLPSCVLVPAVIWPLGKQSSLIWLKINYF